VSKSILSDVLAIVDDEGTLPYSLKAAEIPLEALNLFSDPRLEKRIDKIDVATVDDFIWGFVLLSVMSLIKENSLKYLLE
jgi:hypothetical protein